MRLPYYRLVNTPSTLFLFVTLKDMIFLMVTSGVLMYFGLVRVWLLVMAGYGLHAFFFRRGKPRGFTWHWLQDKFHPRHFRAGREAVLPPYPTFPPSSNQQ